MQHRIGCQSVTQSQMWISLLKNPRAKVSIIKIQGTFVGIMASLDPQFVFNKFWFTCFSWQEIISEISLKKWEGMGQTCLRSPCCPGTLYPGYSPRSLAGVSVFRLDWIMPILVGSSLFWRRPWWDLWTGLPAWQCSQLLGLKTSSNLTEARRQLCGQGRPESTWSPPTWSRRNWSQTKYQRQPLAAMIRWLIKNMEGFKLENLKAPTEALYGYHVTERTHIHLWHPCLICFTRSTLYSCPATWRWSRGFSRKRVYRVTQLSSPTPGSSFPLTMTSCP